MRGFVFSILTNLRLERLQSRLPTPVYIGLLTFVLVRAPALKSPEEKKPRWRGFRRSSV